jgi:methionyl-tRNA formyltransferase
VYTQPDRPSGRGKKLTPSPVKTVALDHQLPIEQPLSLKLDDAQSILATYNADVMVVVAYGLLLPQVVLDTPRYGCLNVHGSLLPRWRGAAPIQRAVEMGDKETGITIMQMDKGLDTGDMLHKVVCDITDDETSATLHDKLMALGAPALMQVLEKLPLSELKREPQNNVSACYAEKITKVEAIINWQEPAQKIAQKIRAFNPFPIAYGFLGKDRIKIYDINIEEKELKKAPEKIISSTSGEILSVGDKGIEVACGNGSVFIRTLQIPNKKAMPIADILNGYADRFVVGQQFTSQPLDPK